MRASGARWFYHEPKIVGLVPLFFVAPVLLLVLTLRGLLPPTMGFATSLLILGLAAVFAGAFFAIMGPGSGYPGLWTLRVFREAGELLSAVDRGLVAAGYAVRPDEFAPRRRWFRFFEALTPLRLDDGTRVWIGPLRGSRPGRRRPPVSWVAVDAAREVGATEMERLKLAIVASLEPP